MLKWLALITASAIVYLMWQQKLVTVTNDNGTFKLNVQKRFPTFNPLSMKTNTNALSFNALPPNIQVSAKYVPPSNIYTGSTVSEKSGRSDYDTPR